MSFCKEWHYTRHNPWRLTLDSGTGKDGLHIALVIWVDEVSDRRKWEEEVVAAQVEESASHVEFADR